MFGLIFFALMVVVLIVLYNNLKWHHPNIAKSIVLAFIVLCMVPVTFINILVVAFISIHYKFYMVMIILLSCIFVAFIGCALWKVLKKKRVYIPLVISTAVCLLVTAGFAGYHGIIAAIPTVSEDKGFLYTYGPYEEDTKVAELHEKSDLKIEEDIPKMDGATALYPVYSAFAKAVYPKEELVDSREYLDCDTTSGAYEDIVTGDADIIFVAAPSKAQEEYAKRKGVELVYTPIGREAFVFFVNSKNPINDISLEQVQDIYSGNLTKWNQLGVKGLGDIKAFQREEGSGSQSTLIKIMNGKTIMMPLEEEVVSAMGGIISKTADYKNFKNAIGYSFRFYSTEMVKNDKIKLLSINGVQPTIENIENGTYPMASHFYAVTRKDMSENTRKLLEWIVGEQGQELIEQTGYTPLE